MQDLDKGSQIFFAYAKRYALSGESHDLVRGYGGMLLKNEANFLTKIFLSKCSGKKSLKISMSIATTTKNNCESVRGYGACFPAKF